MLIEISRMLATRGDYSADGSYYGYYGVMGPDEFQMMVIRMPIRTIWDDSASDIRWRC